MNRTSRRQLWVILIIVFCGTIGLSMPYLIFPSLFLNEELGLLGPNWSEAARGFLLGLTLAAYPLGQFIGSPIVGALSDEHGRKRVLSVTLLIATASCFLTAIAVEARLLWLLLGSRFVMGLMEGNMAIARAMAADLKDIDKHSSFGSINAVASMGWLLGPLAGGLLASRSLHGGLTFATPFYVMTGLFLLQALLVFVAIQKRAPHGRAPKRSFIQRINFPKRLRQLMRDPRLSTALLLATAFTLAVDTFFEFGPVYLTAEWEFDPPTLALYNGLLCGALMIGSSWLVSRARHFPLGAALCGGALGFSLTIVATVLAGAESVLLPAYALTGVGLGLTATKLTIEISNSAAEEIQGEVMGVQSSLRQLGDAAICLVGGALLAISPALILGLAAVVSALVALLCWRVYREG